MKEYHFNGLYLIISFYVFLID